jgi:hypothetical protein
VHLLHLALQDLDQSVPLLTVFKLETSGQSVQIIEREILHGLDKVVVEVIRDPSVQRTSERVLLDSISRDALILWRELTLNDQKGG